MPCVFEPDVARPLAPLAYAGFTRPIWLKGIAVKSHWGILLIALLVLVTGPRAASAGEGVEPLGGPPAATKEPWKIELTPYLWATGVKGSLSGLRIGAPVDASFSDLLSKLEYAGNVHVEAHRGRLGFFLDGFYYQGSDNASGRLLSVDARLKYFMGEAGATYGVIQFPLGDSKTRRFILEALAGARYSRMEADIEAATPRRNHDITRTLDWADPIIGARATLCLSDRLKVSLRGDVGGGVGDGSEHAVNVIGSLDYRVSKRCTLNLGYRYYDFLLERGPRKMDITMKGPVIGCTIGF